MHGYGSTKKRAPKLRAKRLERKRRRRTDPFLSGPKSRKDRFTMNGALKALSRFSADLPLVTQTKAEANRVVRGSRNTALRRALKKVWGMLKGGTT